MNIKLLYTALLTLLLLTACGSSGDEPTPVEPDKDTVVEKTDGWVLYEAYPGMFGKTQALKALTNELPRIKKLGANVIWLMPIFTQGEKDAIGSPYCVKDYYGIHPAYGTLADLKQLVSQAHNQGMLVILDWVANHTSWDNTWLTEHKDWYTQDANGNVISPAGMGWNDVADLNYGNSAMRKAMEEAMMYWITEADVDGFRCDYAEGIPTDFWRDAITKLRAAKEGTLLMLAEGSQLTLCHAGFDMLYAWNFAYKLQDVYAGKASITDLYALHKEEFASLPEGKQRLRYITNHDMASTQSPVQAYNGKEGAFSAQVITLAMGGAQLLYGSQEVAYADALSFFGYREIDWGANASYQQDYAKLMQLYRKSPALQHGDIKLYQTGKAVCCYRTSETEKILVLVNTTGATEKLNLPMERAGDKATDLWTGKSSTLERTITLAPYQYYIWKIE